MHERARGPAQKLACLCADRSDQWAQTLRNGPGKRHGRRKAQDDEIVLEPQQGARERRRVWLAGERHHALSPRLSRERLKRGDARSQIALDATDLRVVEILPEPGQQLRESVRHLSENLGGRLPSQSIRSFGEHRQRDGDCDRAAEGDFQNARDR